MPSLLSKKKKTTKQTNMHVGPYYIYNDLKVMRLFYVHDSKIDSKIETNSLSGDG